MRVWGAIIIGLVIVGIPTGMIWWNSKQKEKLDKTKNEYSTPTLGRIFKN